MKKIYIQPTIESTPIDLSVLLAGSGPSGKDSSSPDVGGKSSAKEEHDIVERSVNIWDTMEKDEYYKIED